MGEAARSGRPDRPGRVAPERVRFRGLIEAGMRAGLFEMASARLASYAILDPVMGVAVWFRDDGELTEDAVIWQYSQFALRIVGVR
nr:hypothetical protein [Frankia sp. Mgl5]